MSFKSIRTTTAYNTGQRYLEFTVDLKPTAGAIYFGFDDGTQNYVAPGTLGIGEWIPYVGSVGYKSSGQIFSNTTAHITNPGGTAVAPFEEGDVISLLVDLDAGSLIFWKNGVPQTTIPFPSATDMYVAVSLRGNGQQITANFSQDVPFVHLAPGGYTDWAGNAI